MKSKLANREFYSLTTDELLYAYGCTGQFENLEAFIHRHQAHLLNFLQLQSHPSYALLLSSLVWQEVAKNADDYQQQCSSKAWLFNIANFYLTALHQKHNACLNTGRDWQKSGQCLLNLSKATYSQPSFSQIYPIIYWPHIRLPEYASKILSTLKSSQKYSYLMSFSNLSIHDISFVCKQPYQDVIANIKAANQKIASLINSRLFEKMLNDKLIKVSQNASVEKTIKAIMQRQNTNLIGKALTNKISSFFTLSAVLGSIVFVLW